jgi:hypothetical protein
MFSRQGVTLVKKRIFDTIRNPLSEIGYACNPISAQRTVDDENREEIPPLQQS